MPKKMLNKKTKKQISEDDQDIDTIISEESHAKTFGSIDKEIILQQV